MVLLKLDQLRSLKAAGRYQDAHNLYLQLVAMRETDAEACLIGGQAAKKLGNLWAAKDALESCLEREPEGSILGMARFLLGEVTRQLGKAHEAIQHLTAFIDGLKDYPELHPVGYGPALYNRGLALQYAGRIEDSLCAFKEACQEFRAEGMSQYLYMSLLNLSWVGCLLGDSVQASACLKEARPLCDSPYLQWHYRVGEAFLAAIDSDPLDTDSCRAAQQRALDLCRVIYQHEGEDVPAEVRSQALWLAGTISLDLREVDAALHFGERAMQYAFDASVGKRCLYDAADLLRQVHAVRSPVNRTGP